MHLPVEQPVLALVGPTAVGKTGLSLRIARTFQCEIVSVDSMQVYRFMDIGTAKASVAERQSVPHHLIDIVDPDEPYHAGRFARDALTAIRQIHNRGAIPLLVGGTGLYLRALRHGLFDDRVAGDSALRRELISQAQQFGSPHIHRELARCDPLSAERLHPHDKARIIRALEVFHTTGEPLSAHLARHAATQATVFSRMLCIALDCPRPELYQRIDHRSATMMEQGLEQEVHSLLQRGYTKNLKSMQSIGYRHMLNYIDGAWSKDDMLTLLARDTRRYAKRQYTWFRKEADLQWFDRWDQDNIIDRMAQFLAS